MTEKSTSAATPTRPRLRSIALPVEHGGWGFTIEPVLLGLLVAPSAAAWELAVASIAVFLARRPVKLLLVDLTRRRWLPRSRIALMFAAIYGMLAVAGLTGAIVTADRRFVFAFLAAAPLAAVALYADARAKSRTFVAEFAGASAMGSTVAAMALADGWSYGAAFGLWLVLAARALTTISLVREQIRRVHDVPVRGWIVYSVTAASVLLLAVTAAVEIVPWLAVVAIAGIGVLAVVSLRRPPVPARVVGWTQMITGLVVVVLTAVGVWRSW